MFDNHLLTLRKSPFPAAAVLDLVGSVPGSYRKSSDDTLWILPDQAGYIGPEEEVRLYATVAVHEDRVVVRPGATEMGVGRARKLVGWLLSLGAWEVEAGSERIGTVDSIAQIFSREWPDPDITADPTRSPPATGWLLSFKRNAAAGAYEVLRIHQNGSLSFRSLPSDGQGVARLFRRLDDATRKRLESLIGRPPFNRDEPGPDGEYQREVWLELETPAGGNAPRIDAARPPRAYRELIAFLERLASALAADPEAMPSGLVAPAPPQSRWEAPRPSTDSPVAIGELLVVRRYAGDDEQFVHDQVRIHRSGLVTMEIYCDDDHLRWDGVVDDEILARLPALAGPLWSLQSRSPREVLDRLELRVETPHERRDATIDVTRPPPEVKELASMCTGWLGVLDKDPAARPSGLKSVERTR